MKLLGQKRKNSPTKNLIDFVQSDGYSCTRFIDIIYEVIYYNINLSTW